MNMLVGCKPVKQWTWTTQAVVNTSSCASLSSFSWLSPRSGRGQWSRHRTSYRTGPVWPRRTGETRPTIHTSPKTRMSGRGQSAYSWRTGPGLDIETIAGWIIQFIYIHKGFRQSAVGRFSGEDSCRIVQIGSTSKQSTYLESGMISEQNVISAQSVKWSCFFLVCFNTLNIR